MQKTNLSIIILIMIILVSSVILAEEYQLTSFNDCYEYDLYIEVSGLDSTIEGAYELPYCNLFDSKPGKHIWRCVCNDSINLTLKTLAKLDQTYSLSVFGLTKGTNYSHLKDYIESVMPVERIMFNPVVQEKKNRLTGAVIGSQVQYGVIGFAILLVIIFLLYSIHYLGGLPWVNKKIRALNLHKKGQKAFENSKHKKAKRYYQRAAKLR